MPAMNMNFFAATATITAAATLAATTPRAEAFARRTPFAVVARSPSSRAAAAATPRGGGSSSPSALAGASSAVGEVVEVPTAPIAGMRPGTSGLRKKVEVWMGEHYVENFVQSLLDAGEFETSFGEFAHGGVEILANGTAAFTQRERKPGGLTKGTRGRTRWTGLSAPFRNLMRPQFSF